MTDKRAFAKTVRSPLFKRLLPLRTDRVIVVRGVARVTMSSPQYIGFTILDRAKYHLYHFYYEVLKPFYGEKISLVYSDTDSYVLKIQTEDLHKDFQNTTLAGYIDTSNFPPSHSCYSSENKGKLGCLKSEVGAEHIAEAICLKPKTYSLQIHGRKDPALGTKGISNYEKKKLGHCDFQRVMNENSVHRFTQTTLTTVKGEMCTVQYRNKRGLSLYDDKRFYVDKFTTLGYGHPDIPPLDQQNEHFPQDPSEDELVEEDIDMVREKKPRKSSSKKNPHDIWKRRIAWGDEYFTQEDPLSLPAKRRKTHHSSSLSHGIVYEQGKLTSKRYRSSDVLLVQQSDCVTIRSHGLSEKLSRRYPYSNVYTTRRQVRDYNRAIVQDRPSPGSIHITKPPVGSSSPLIASIYGQFYMGEERQHNIMNQRLEVHLANITNPSNKDPHLLAGLQKDTRKNRLKWFKEALRTLGNETRNLGIKKIVFPHRIGCDIAGGKWKEYLPAIKAFAKETLKHGTSTVLVEKV